MPSIPLTQFEGLVTAPGLLARNPASCIDVLNFEFPAPGVMRKRRGFEMNPGNTGGPVWKLLTSRLMGNNLLAHMGVGSSGVQLRYGDGSVALAALAVVGGGNLTRSSSTRMQGAVCQRNYYATADEGVARVESNIGAADVRFAGMPRGYPAHAAGVVAGSNILAGYARAYRVTWHRLDADGIELGGAPTARMVAANTTYMGGTGVAAALRIQFQVPWEWGTINTALATDYFWKLWGTRTYDETNQVGDDEMGLVAQRLVSSAEVVAGFVSYDDNTPDSYLDNAPRLHTNTNNFPPSEAGLLQGIVNSDAPPPLANDVAYWQDVMWYADVEFRRSITAALFALPVDGDVFVVTTSLGSVSLTARTAPALPNEFQIFTTGPTTAINLRETVRHMMAALNRRSLALGLGVAGYTTGTATQTSGLFLIELTRPLAVLTLNTSFAYEVRLELFGGYRINTNAGSGAASSTMMWSKPLRADAVPPINQLTAGPKDGRILRVMALRDMLVVFTDYGIYRVTGRTYADFATFPLDLGYRLIGRELVAQCDEKLYAWCYEGIVEIDEGGVRVVSMPIEPTIETLILAAGAEPSLGTTGDFSVGQVTLATLGFATAYRQQHQVRFHYPQLTDASLNGCSRWLAFDTRTRAWTVGGFTDIDGAGFLENRACAVVRLTDDRLMMGNWSNGADTYLFLERREFDASDFIDDYADGKTVSVLSLETTQYQVPQQQGAQHWQQFVVSWDAEERAYRPLPTAMQLEFTTEDGTSASGPVSVSELLTRFETPLARRRGNRLRVTLIHNLAEYCGIVGLEQEYASGTRFGRRVAP